MISGDYFDTAMPCICLINTFFYLCHCLILLSDCSGYEISLVLWGERAIAFDGGDVLRIGQVQPVIAIFVGTLVKPFEGGIPGLK